MHPLLDIFEKTCTDRVDRAAASDQSLTLDFRSFRAVVGGLATQMKTATERQAVGILAPTSTVGAVSIFACWYAGKTPVPLNFMLAPEEIAKIVRDAGLDTVLTIERFAPLAQMGGLKTIVLNAQTLVPGACSPPEAKLEDTAVLLYTSGTSGDPKGVMLTFNNLVSNTSAAIEHARIDVNQVLLSVLPQFHSFGFTAMTILPLTLGATVHYIPRFSPVALMNLLSEKQVTIFMAIPSMYGAMLQMKNADPNAFKTVKLAISGGEPLPAKVAQGFEQRFGVRLMEGYGLTETSPVVSINLPWMHKPGSVGKALPGITVTAVDDKGNALGADKDGELIIRGHCVMKGYHNKPAETAAVVRSDGFHTGDIGRIDADGFIYITGRAKEMMIVGGENVFPREIENVLLEHSAVGEAAVIGVMDEMRGELPVAFVILKEGAAATETDLRNFCRDRLAGYKIPRQVKVATDLPRGSTGKILKRGLAKLL